MKKKSVWSFFAVFAVVLLLIPTSVATSIQGKTSSESIETKKLNDIAESHVIQDVPIVGQDIRFYCTIASLTMILNYYGFNLTKYEVFYLTGGGFSLIWRESNYLKIHPSYECAFRPSNYDFVASILNLTFQPFYADLTLDEDEVWDQVWTCILENISRDQAVEVNLDTAILSANQFGIKIPISIWKNIPLFVSHSIIVVGYNQSNQSICYHDPGYSIYGDEKKGAYLWTSVDVFKTAFERFFIPTGHRSTYRIKSFEKPLNISYDKELIIEQAYQRNIKRLQGEFHYYASYVDHPDWVNINKNDNCGLDALYRLKAVYGGNLQTQLYTLSKYKRMVRLGLTNTFFYNFDKFLQRFLEIDFSYTFDLYLPVPGYKNNYKFIAEEKQMISEVLLNYAYLSPIYENCSELLQNESELWFKIADYHRTLLNKGRFITIPRALHIFNQISSTLDEIIQIQQEIVSLYQS
jgi:hypothetical protein